MCRVEVKCSYEQIYRYTTTLMCEGLDASFSRVYVDSADDGVAESGEFVIPQVTMLDLETTPALRILLYVICNTFPDVVEVKDAPPFDIELKVSRGGKVIYDRLHKVNQWGGITLDFTL